MKLQIKQLDNCIAFEFGERDSDKRAEMSLAIRPEEMKEVRHYYHAIFDGHKVIVLEPHCWTVLNQGEVEFNLQDGFQNGSMRAWVVFVDTAKLFKRSLELREKFLPLQEKAECKWRIENIPMGIVTTSTERFRAKVHEVPPLTWMQILKHSNGHNLAEAIVSFKKRIRRELLPKLQFDLSRFLQSATVYGQGTEFYFDGRRTGGCGFNGGIIPHRDEYGIHT
jgi:hypothetical protein